MSNTNRACVPAPRGRREVWARNAIDCLGAGLTPSTAVRVAKPLIPFALHMAGVTLGRVASRGYR